MFGDAKAVIDRCIAAGRIKARGGADRLRRDAGEFRDDLGAVAFFGDESRPGREFSRIATLLNEGFVDETFGHDDMRQRIENGDIGARTQREMIIGFDMRRLHQIGLARIDDDEFRASA